MSIFVWGFAVVVAALPAILARFSTELGEWTPAYLAGGFGGMVLELLLSRWQLELPSFSPAKSDPVQLQQDGQEEAEETDEIFASPTGSRVDIGFFGRFFTAGLAAIALIILAEVVLADESLEGIQAEAGSTVTIAWALVIGSASPAVWRALRKVVEARVAAARDQDSKKLAVRDHKIKNAKVANKEVLERAGIAREDGNKKGDSRFARALQTVQESEGRVLLVSHR